MGTITSANASIALTVPGADIAQQPLQGFAADDAFMHDAFDITETRMGVDGTLSAGYTPNPKTVHITFQPDSASIAAFEAWGQAQETLMEALPGSLVIALPSIGKVYNCTVGWLKSFKKMPDGRKVLDPQTYSIEFQNIAITPL